MAFSPQSVVINNADSCFSGKIDANGNNMRSYYYVRHCLELFKFALIVKNTSLFRSLFAIPNSLLHDKQSYYSPIELEMC